MRDPFHRKCCAVPLLVRSDDAGSVVSGIAQVNGATIEFVGVVVGPDDDDDIAIFEALLAARQVFERGDDR